MPASAFSAEPLTVDIYGPGQRLVNMTLLNPRMLAEDVTLPIRANKLQKMIANNLSYLPFLREIPASQLLGGDPSKGIKAADIDFKPLQLGKIDLVMTSGWKDSEVELRVFETLSGRMVVGKAYGKIDDKSLPLVAARFCSVLLQALTGKKGFFESPIAFVRQLGKTKEIYTVLPQGRELTRITKLGGFNLSPSWSHDGKRIVFTHIGARSHELGIWDSATNKITLKRNLGNSVISPVFTPNDRVAVTLNRTGTANIYLLDKNYRVARSLAASHFIDVSPSFDAKGEKMVFTSGRAGNPHIYMFDLKTGEVRRITITGKYNTHPCISPNGRYIAYTHMTSEGHRIYLHDLQTGQEKQLTFGPGNDEYPAFGPDGYFIAFSSDRSGTYKLYLSTRHGDPAKMLRTGNGAAYAPAWDTASQR